jgi:hypothetical protein
MHDRLVRFILKVAVPTTLEMWGRPLLHLREFLLGRTNFDTSLNAIGGKWSSTLEIPFVEDRFLDFWDTADEVVEALSVRIR